MGWRGYLVSPVGHGKSLVAAGCFSESLKILNRPDLYLTTVTAAKEQVEKLRAYGLNAVLLTSKDRKDTWRNTVAGTVYVTNLEAVQCPNSEWEDMRRVPWGCVIVDEADQLTAGASKRNKRLLTMTAPHRLMMSATPLRNGLKDVYMPVMWLSRNPPWRNWTDFKTRELLFGNPQVPNMLTGLRDEEHLASLMSPLTFTMINPDAPKELVATVISCPLGTAQMLAYEELKKNLMIEAASGTLTISNQAVLNLRLRQMVAMPEALGITANSSKESALVELLKGLEGKTVIFTSFSTVAKILGKRYGWPVICGDTPAKERKRIADSQPEVMVATSAAERGIDLEYLTNVISFDLGFTSATSRQRNGRATRYGRSGEAKAFLLQSPNTVDITSEAKIVLKKLKQARKVYDARSQGN